MVNFDFSKLRGRIVEKFGNTANFAKKLGISRVALSNKLSGKTNISLSEIVEWSMVLDIDMEEVPLFFMQFKFN